MLDPITIIGGAYVLSTGIRKYKEQKRKNARIASLVSCPAVEETVVAWTPELLELDAKSADTLMHAMDVGAFIEHGTPMPAGAPHG